MSGLRSVRLLAAAALLVAARAGLAQTTPTEHPTVVRLTNGSLVVSVAPLLGGRVVELRTATGENLLNADPRYWSAPPPPPELGTPFEPWNGHTYWVGPQSAWWTQQDLDAERRKARAPWPPDPFQETARYEIRERSETRLVLESTSSPITGLSRRLEVELVAPRMVRLRVTATNVRPKPVAWDLWSNTRARPEGWAYVRLAEGGIRKVDGPGDGSPAYPHAERRGFFVSPPGEKPIAPQAQRTSKAFLRPESGEIDYFRGHELLRKRTDAKAESRLHPEQALVEIYRSAGREPAEDLLELEMHGPYETLAPGATLSFEETWEVVDYPGPADPEAHVAFLEGLSRSRTTPLPPR
ncbi:MAG TPA: DUF4380 domain-containing protein [Vicinamibacteria bacterium]|nr:DUF4380 domain-containing protein [Vicinamibacteria bacterium]